MLLPWKRILIALGAATFVTVVVVLLLPEPIEVDTGRVQRGAMQVTVDDQGETRSHDRYVLTAPVAGRLLRIELHDGDAVQDNQLVARIAALPLSLRESDELHARVASALAAQSEADQRLKAATENHAQAVRELDRVSRLVKDGFLSPQAAEQARNAEINAASEVEAARFRARAAAADVRVARSGLGVSRAPGGLVDVRSPLMGEILRIPDASERIVAAGTPLMTLGDLHHLEVVVELLSTEAVKVAPGMPVLIEGWGGDRPLRAKVRRVEPYAVTKVSALGIEEKRVNVVADFVDAPDHLGDGYRVTARVVIWQSPNVLKVPASALFRCEKAWCVFAVEGGRAHVRHVDIGQRNVNEAEVRSGLSDGQIVIRYPSNDLADGARVRGR